ncbi:hypothetical protein GCM10010435_39430 [Winogradskya consettensis]|uniref:Uncharacterized protein n=1 Tax=Winogradskya consettensis TaxID=113560 RepID=A0A919SF12_9ACTN|nr:non-ribosomal peptide synthetase/type I polyketide synthase [Actinoplanes consettensis]GIM69512.1 hypothetical protein Aco04nite_15560 [Actinoplanes consettensis]
MPELDELTAALAACEDIADFAAGPGEVFVVPAPGVDARDARRIVTAAVLPFTRELPQVTAVTGIARTDEGDLDRSVMHAVSAPSARQETPVTPEIPEGPAAIIGGGTLPTGPDDPPDLVRALLRAANRFPDRGLTLVEADGTRHLTYAQLRDAALRTLTGLRGEGLRPGDPVILHAPTLTGHFTALWACVLGGVQPVAVAQAPGYEQRNATLDKLMHAWRTLGEPPVLSGGATVAALTGYAGGDGMRVHDLAAYAGAAPAPDPHLPAAGDVAVLQLSSGSTSQSKIIPLTHRGLLRYAQGARHAGRFRDGDTALNWLPLDHVAALVMTHLGPILLGSPSVHVATSLILADPLRWLDLLQEYRAEHSWSPNFGFKLVAEALRRGDPRSWDLRHVRSLVNAGEQCTEPVMRRFAEATEQFGLGVRPLLLAWGMAETCTVTGYQPFDDTAAQHVRVGAGGVRLDLHDRPAQGDSTLLSMGPPVPGTEMRVTAADGSTALPERHIGRLQVRSERVLPGYLHNPEANREAFPDGDWFDTGDLAFVHEGRMTITGRAKEVIIVNGVHYFCHEIEDAVGEVDGVAVSFVAALGVPDAEGIERIAVLFVPAGAPDPELLSRIRRHLAERLQIIGATVVAVRPDQFDKTTSGKIQRAGMRARWIAGGYDTGSVFRGRWSPFLLRDRPSAVTTRIIPDDLGLTAQLTLPAGDVSDRIVYAASYVGPESTGAALAACSDRLLDLIRDLLNDGWTGELVTVSRGLHRIDGTEPGSAPAALTASIGESLALEHPGLRVWHLDLPGHDVDADAAALQSALDANWQHHEPVIAWRGRPLVWRLHAAEPAPDNAEPLLRRGSRWLVTGGRGGVAAALLGALPHGLDLLVTGRGSASPDSDPALLALTAAGHRVSYSSALDLEQAVVAFEDDGGAPLDGVLHLAGDYALEPLADTEADRWRAHTYAKVEGSLAVAAVLARRPGCRLVAFSSLVARVPVAGAGAYAAGNRFLEALCDQLAATNPVWCLSWGAWRGTGISRGQRGIEDTLRRYARVTEPAAAAAQTLTALTLAPGHLLLGVDPAATRFRGLIQPPSLLAPSAAVPARATPPATMDSGVHRLVRDALPPGIPDHTPFYDAGLDSVAILRAHTLLEQSLGRTLPQTMLFEHGTPAALAAHLAGDRRPADSPLATTADTRIAVIGIALRFPEAGTTAQYWQNLLDGRISIRRFTRDELLTAGLSATLVDDPQFVPASGALEDIAGFDAELFAISPREAALMDPQHRKFLEVCHEALEDGGYAGTNRPIALYAGSGMHLYSLRTYLREQLAGLDPADQVAALQATIGNESDFLASRVAYKLGLTGPAVSVQTACSTSLVAVHQAVRALLAGDAEMALAGASALHIPGIAGYRYEQGSILSPTGTCRAFDASADGTVGGNGVAAVLLKPLDRALADGDTVHAVITGTAVNNDGADKAGYAAPSVTGHAAVIRRALTAAGLGPDDIGYLETHGTGTPVGDPIEIEALRTVYATRRRPLTLGAVKPNIGHLDTCAGMAGLIKAILAIRHGVIPPIAGLHQPSPALRLGDSPFVLPTTAAPWPLGQPRRAGISALGVGGTNAHVIIEQAPPQVPTPPSSPGYLIPLSAVATEPLATLAERVADRLEDAEPPTPADVLTTLGEGRRRYVSRLVVWGETASETATSLREHAAALRSATVPLPLHGVTGRATAAADSVVFALSGQGTDTTRAAAELMHYPIARDTLRECATLHDRWWGGDLFTSARGNTALDQPALLAIQVAQGRLLSAMGINPDVLIGHSAGEYAALCLAGALNLPDALFLTALRGNLMRQRTAPGAALAVLTDDTTAAELCEILPGLTHTVRNSPDNQVIAGTPEAIHQARAALDDAGIRYRPLTAEHAFHSAAMDPILTDLTIQADLLTWHPLQIPLVNHPAGTLLNGTHVAHHTRSQADYRTALESLHTAGHRTFLELGPAATLTALGQSWPDTTWIPLARKTGGVPQAAADLFRTGHPLTFTPLTPPAHRIPLPTTPFRPTPHWHTRPTPATPTPAPSAAADSEAGAGPADAELISVAPAVVLPAAGGLPAMPSHPSAAAPAVATIVLTRVQEITARHLGTSPADLPTDRPFFDLGADSLLMINMLRELESTFGIRIAMRELFEDYDTAALLAQTITTRMPPTQQAALATIAVTSTVPSPSPDMASVPAIAPPTAAPSSPLPAAAPLAAIHPAAEPGPAAAPAQAARPMATPSVQVAAPASVPAAAPHTSAAASPTFGAPAHLSPPSGSASPARDEIVRSQLDLIGRFTDLMAQQLQAMPADPTAPPPSPPASALPPPSPQPLSVPQPPSVPQFPSAPGPSGEAQFGPRPQAIPRSATSGRMDARQQQHVDDLIKRYTARTATSKQITQRHRRRLADSRAVVGFRRATKEMLYPIAARSSKGAHMIDVDGNSYVDITMGFGTLLFGHEPAFVTDAVSAFLDNGMRFGPRSEETGEVAELLCELTGMDRAAFATTGTEANSGALRIARAYTGRSVVVTFEGSYHGHIDPVLSRSVPDGAGLRTVPVSEGIPDSAVAEIRVLTYGDPASLEAIAREAGQIAAVVIEPVPSRHPDRQPVEFVRHLRELCDRHGIVLIFDEMLTGFRPHQQGAQALFNVRADLATYGKVLGGGYPIGAIAGRADIMDWVDGGFWSYGDASAPPQDTTFFGGTYLQHPVSMVAAKAVLQHLRDEGPALQEHLNARTTGLATTLNDYFTEEEFPLRLHHFGSLFRFTSTASLDLFFHHLLLNGIHVWEWRNFFLSTAHTDADLTLITNAAKTSLTDLRAAGFFPHPEAHAAMTPPALTAPALTAPALTAPAAMTDSAAMNAPAPRAPAPTAASAAPAIPAPAAAAIASTAIASTAATTWPGVTASPAATNVQSGRPTPTHSTQVPRTPDTTRPGTRAVEQTPKRSPKKPDLSLYFFGDYPRESAQAKYTAIIDAATFGDEHGLHAVWLPERHFDSFGGIFPDPAVLAAALATRTTRIGLRAGCVVLPLHDPILVAEQWSMVDNLSGGRVALGCASGWHARDFVLAPHAYGDHRDRMYEGIDRIKQLWRGEAVTGTAGDGTQTEVRLFPRPIQPMPDFYTAVVGNPDSYRRAGAAGLGVITNLMAQTVEQLAANIAIYRAARHDAGLDPEAGRVVLLLHTYLGDDGEQARAEAFEPFCDYLRSSLALFGQLTNSLGMHIDLDSTPADDLEFLLRRAYERYTTDRALIGGARECAPLVARLTELGVDEVGCFVDFGVPPDRMLAGLPGIEQLGDLLEVGERTRTLTPAQEQMWLAEQTGPGPAYTESVFVRLTGDLDVTALGAAFDLVVQRHPLLRATFAEVDGAPRMLVGDARPRPLPVTEGETEAGAVDAETRHRFDLTAGPLFEPRLIREAPQQHLLVVRMHHLVIDTLSAEILTREISTAYRAYKDDRDPGLPALPPAPQRESNRNDVDQQFWVTTLADRAARAELPADRPRPLRPTGAGENVRTTIDDAQHDRIAQFCREHRVTVYTVLVSALAIALRRLTGEPDVIIGSPVADRPDGTEQQVGPYLSTLPIRVRVNDRDGFADLTRSVRTTVLDAHDHRSLGLPAILAATHADKLFDVVIQYDRAPVFALDLPGVDADPLPLAARRAPFDLTFSFTGWDLRLDYATDLFDEPTARRVLDQFLLALRTGLARPGAALASLPRLTAADAAHLTLWQHGRPPAPYAQTPITTPTPIHEPTAAAVVTLTVHEPTGITTAQQLQEKAAALAATLRSAGAGPGTLVGIELPRGADAVTAMLATLWTGAGYVPLDPAQPAARRAEIAAAAQVVTVVTPEMFSTVDTAERFEPVTPDPDDTAYVLYTSGSTGRPKGCRIPHRAIANTVAWWIDDLAVTAADRLSWYCSPGFDASCVEVWPAVRTGAALFPVPDDIRLEPEKLQRWLIDNRITVAMFPTPMGELLLDLDWTGETPALRHLVVGGDRLRHCGPATLPFALTNIYGPTEATVACTTARVSPGTVGAPPIGRPVPGMWVRVLDEHGEPVPPGVPGELYVGGVQLSDGYLGAPDETKQRFVQHDRFGAAYRTGDVGRWRNDGQLEFLHRNDEQVQIRGYRVEPGEVEHRLRGLPGVREAAVRSLPDHRGEVMLAGYVVADSDTVTPESLTNALATDLPAYMIPSVWTLLPALPVTANGKLDRAALPTPITPAPAPMSAANTLESRLHELWCAEIGRTAIGVHETFFAAGGHSLGAVRLLNRVRTEFGRAPGVQEFLSHPTIHRMAQLLRKDVDPEVVRSAPAAVVQARQRESTLASDVPSVLTIAVRFTLTGAVDHSALQQAVTALAERHPALRTRYAVQNNTVIQQVLRPLPVPLTVRTEPRSHWNTIATQWAALPFALDDEPGFRATLLTTPPPSPPLHPGSEPAPSPAPGFTAAEPTAELLLAIHHGVCDGWSLGVMTEDLAELYRAAQTNTPADLPVLDADFIDFADWERAYLQDPRTRQELQTWADTVTPGLHTLVLPTDHPRTPDQSRSGAAHYTELPSALMDKLSAYATERTSTPYAVLAAAFAWFAHHLTGAGTIPLNSTVANRPDARFDRVVGVFANAAWLIIPTTGARTFNDLVDRATRATWQMLAMQSIPSRTQTAALGEAVASPERVYFAMLDEGDTELRLPGLAPAPARPIDLPGARGDQAWQLQPLPNGTLRLEIIYATALFSEPTVAAWATRYLTLLTQALTDPTAPLPPPDRTP